jgi:hypothetical protein
VSGVRSWLVRRGLRPVGDPRVLVDHWYSHAVGHVIEALRRCLGYHACDPAIRPSLVLNGASPVELVRCAPFVDRAYAVPYTSFGTPEGSPRAALRQVPRDWDYVLHHPAATDPHEARFEGLRRYYEASRRHFRARVATGVAGQAPPDYAPHHKLRLELPDDARAEAERALDGSMAIAVMPAGSSSLRALYPSVSSWTLILDELERRFPDVVFTFVGRVEPGGGRTLSGITRDEVDRLIGTRRAIDVFDRPILDQLAAVEAASLFVSPHTGFGFAAVAADTPWLTIAGGDWHEYFFNGVPFYSVLPKATDHPAFVHSKTLPMIAADDDGEGARTPTMSASRIRADLDELAEAAVTLVEGRLSYDHALRTYFPRLLEAYRGDRSQISTFEDVHLAFI